MAISAILDGYNYPMTPLDRSQTPAHQDQGQEDRLKGTGGEQASSARGEAPLAATDRPVEPAGKGESKPRKQSGQEQSRGSHEDAEAGLAASHWPGISHDQAPAKQAANPFSHPSASRSIPYNLRHMPFSADV